MSYYADLHLHSRHSRATSPQMTPAHLHRAALVKGVALLGTGDLTHPAWLAELESLLVPAEEGFLALAPERARAAETDLPAHLVRPVRFVLSGEVACHFRRGDRARRVHLCLLAPSFAAARSFNASLAAFGDLAADGRPALRADVAQVARLALDAGLAVFPAHVFTPFYSVFGAGTGFSSPEEAFGDLSPRLLALETGLSADPPMVRRVDALRGHALLSNSDAHSPERIAREANLFSCAFDLPSMIGAIRTGRGFAGTIEFHPGEGKYHLDGHRDCGFSCAPERTRELSGRCPVCGEPLTIGVRHRIEELVAAQPPSSGAGRPSARAEIPHRTLVPLLEILAEVDAVKGPGERARRSHDRLVETFGPELAILTETPLEELEPVSELLALAIGRMRQGRAAVSPGFDGLYGRVRLLSPEGENGGQDVPGQLPLF